MLRLDGAPMMQRRELLRATATALIGAALPSRGARAEGAGPGPTMRALSAYMAAAGDRALPNDAAEHARHHALDTLAAMVSGSDLLPGRAARRYVEAYGGRGTATIAGTTATAAPADAALANGVMAHADET